MTSSEEEYGEAAADKRGPHERARAERKAKLRDELSRKPGAEPFVSPLSLEQRYDLFRETAERTVRELAPRAKLVLDKTGREGESLLIEISQRGIKIEALLAWGLRYPEENGSRYVAQLCRELEAKLGKLEATGEP